MKWDALVDNLILNALIEPEQGPQLDVHFRFLSAYTHPTWSGYEAIDRERGHHPSMWGGRPRSHCLGELALLYAATFAVGEVRSFVESWIDDAALSS